MSIDEKTRIRLLDAAIFRAKHREVPPEIFAEIAKENGMVEALKDLDKWEDEEADRIMSKVEAV